jgi:hypothetical protein
MPWPAKYPTSAAESLAWLLLRLLPNLREVAMKPSDLTTEILSRRRRFMGGLIALPWRRPHARLAGAALAVGMLLNAGVSRAQDGQAGASATPPAVSPNEAAPAPGEAVAARPAPRVEREPRKGLLIGGGITWGVAYTFSLIGAGKKDDPASNWLFVPVAGPFLYLGNHRCVGPDGQPCVDDWATPMVFTMFGVAQSLGAVLVASGFLFPSEHVVGGSGASAAKNDRRPVPSWIVTPAVVGQSGLGVAAAGTLL